MRRRSFPILLALLSLPFATPHQGLAANRKMTAGQFPMGVGSRWVYAVRDSLANRLDTVRIRILGTTDFPGDRRASMWQYRSRSSVDTQFVIRAGDTISFYRSRSPESVTAVFVFPLVPGRSWSVIPPGTMTVKRIFTAFIPAGRFHRSFEVSSRPAVRNSMGGTTYTLAPNVGIVRMQITSINTLTDQRENILWQLLSWKIAR
jgi:hypothetical protein